MVDTQEKGDYSPRTPMAITVAWGAMLQYRIPLAVMVGLSFPAVCLSFVLLGVPIVDIAVIAVAVMLGFYFLALAVICWPWTSYALAHRLSLAAAIGVVCGVLVNHIIQPLGDGFAGRPLARIIFLSVGFVFYYVAGLALLSGFVFVRMRYWPVYPPGHCKQCGYNLTGNVSGNCSECGTPLVSETTIEEGASPQQPSCDEGTISNPND